MLLFLATRLANRVLFSPGRKDGSPFLVLLLFHHKRVDFTRINFNTTLLYCQDGFFQ